MEFASGGEEFHSIGMLYDIANDDDIIRLDILYGIKDLYPDLAARLYG